MNEIEPVAYAFSLKEFINDLRPHAKKLDSEWEVCQKWYREFINRNLHLGGSVFRPFSGKDFCNHLATLSEVSGAFGFLALQQVVANGRLGERIRDFEEVPAIGVAYGHLRNPEGMTPRSINGLVGGGVPWFTGSGIFEYAILGFRDERNQEITALVKAENRPEFQHHEAMKLIACNGIKTVQVQVDRLKIVQNEHISVNTAGHMKSGDASSVYYHTPLMVGNMRASQTAIMDCERVPEELRKRSQLQTENLLSRISSAFVNGVAPALGCKLRAETADYSVRLARLCALAQGGASINDSHPAQRRYREALLFNLMAQTDEIVSDAFRQMFAEEDEMWE